VAEFVWKSVMARNELVLSGLVFSGLGVRVLVVSSIFLWHLSLPLECFGYIDIGMIKLAPSQVHFKFFGQS
jgi:hypothetical protein